MSARFLKTLGAVIVLVILWFAFTRWNKHESREQSVKSRQTSTQKLLPINSGRITSFTLTQRDGTMLKCEKQGATWVITQPLPLPADQSKVEAFLQSLTTAAPDQQIAANPAGLADFGLAPPAETVEAATGASPAQFTLLLGDETPTSAGVYAKVAGNPRVFTLSDDVKTALEKKLFDLRDTRAVTLAPAEINRIEVKNGNQTYTLAKNPDGVWDVLLPTPVRADHFSVEGLTDGLQSLAMQSIVSENKTGDAKYGFGKPTLTAKLSTSGGSQTLVIGKTASQGYYAMNSALAPVFTLDESSVNQFQKSASDFRDKNLFSWDMFNVKSFEVVSSKGDWTFEQSKNQWKRTSPNGKNMNSDDINAFLSTLRGLQANSFPAAQPGQWAPFGLDKPTYTFKVTFGAKNQTETVQVGENSGKYYARRESDSLPGTVSESSVVAIENTFQKLSK